MNLEVSRCITGNYRENGTWHKGKDYTQIIEWKKAQKQWDNIRARIGDLVKNKFPNNSNKESSQKEKKNSPKVFRCKVFQTCHLLHCK